MAVAAPQGRASLEGVGDVAQLSCPDKYTTKLNKAWAQAWVAFGGVGGTADL